MTEKYDAIVYDLDGTLVRLDVDWGAVARAVGEVLATHDIDTAGLSLWEMMDRAAGTGLEADVEATVAEFEREGARESTLLPTAAELPRPESVGVCSLNCEAACRIALEAHDLGAAVGPVVGRDSVAGQKPDPGPLLGVVGALGAEPGSTLFVGDSESDAETAAAAGTEFQYVSRR